MKSKLLGLIVCMALFGAGSASASTLVGPNTDAQGINGLIVDGVTYDVTFVFGQPSTIFASYPPVFNGNETGALDAASALQSALTALDVTGVAGIVPAFEINVPFSTFFSTLSGSQYDLVELFHYGDAWIASAHCLPSTTVCGDMTYDTDYDHNLMAVFAPTPVPAALPLFATGFGALGLLGWRRKRKNAAVIAAT